MPSRNRQIAGPVLMLAGSAIVVLATISAFGRAAETAAPNHQLSVGELVELVRLDQSHLAIPAVWFDPPIPPAESQAGRPRVESNGRALWVEGFSFDALMHRGEPQPPREPKASGPMLALEWSQRTGFASLRASDGASIVPRSSDGFLTFSPSSCGCTARGCSPQVCVSEESGDVEMACWRPGGEATCSAAFWIGRRHDGDVVIWIEHSDQ